MVVFFGPQFVDKIWIYLIQGPDHLLNHNFRSIHMFPVAISCYICVVALCERLLFVFPRQEAIETFKEALKLKSDFIDAYKSLGQAYRYSKSVVFTVYFTSFSPVDKQIMSFCI